MGKSSGPPLTTGLTDHPLPTDEDSRPSLSGDTNFLVFNLLNIFCAQWFLSRDHLIKNIMTAQKVADGASTLSSAEEEIKVLEFKSQKSMPSKAENVHLAALRGVGGSTCTALSSRPRESGAGKYNKTL
jgi:hypothetical protein